MANNSSVIEKLNNIQNKISSTVEYDASLTSIFDYVENKIQQKIPKEAKNIIANAEIMTDDLFYGYEVISPKELKENYENPKNSMSFFGRHSINDDFIASEPLSIIDDEKGRLNKDTEVKDMSVYVPLFTEGGEYIAINVSTGALLVTSEDYTASFMAPSLSSHVSDLIHGLEEDKYLLEENDGYLIAPMTWYQRLQVQSGDYYINEYEEVVKK